MNEIRTTSPKAPGLPRLWMIHDHEQTSSLPEDWGASDLHVHTYFSHDVLPVPSHDPLYLHKTAMERGLKYVSFTDHDTMGAYDRIGWTRDGLVPGVEVKILDWRNVGHTIHINVYMLNKRQYTQMKPLAGRGGNLMMFLEYLRSENLPYVYNHPFWFERGETPNIAAVFDIARLFPVLEYNRGRTALLNALAVSLAEEHGKAMLSTSDSHTRRTVGLARTHAPGETFREYFANICGRRACLLTKDMTAHHMVEEVNEWIQQLFLPSRSGAETHALPVGLEERRMVGPLSVLARKGFIRRNPFWKACEKLLYVLSNAGFAQRRYVRGQENLARRIMEQLPMLASDGEVV